MHIALRINMDGQYLEVTSVCYAHNHPISQVGYLSTEEFQCKCMVLIMNEVASQLADYTYFIHCIWRRAMAR